MDMPTVIVFFLTSLLQISWSSQENTAHQEDQTRLLDQLISASYDPRIRPSGFNGTDTPIDVKVSLTLYEVTGISDYDMEFGVQIRLNQEWLDERLKYEDKGTVKYLTLADPGKVWTPDLHFKNEKDSDLHKLMVPNTFLRINPSGHLLLTSRLSLTLWCNMQLEKFPFDSQVCQISIARFDNTNNDLRLAWRDKDPVTAISNVYIMGFTLKTVGTSSSTVVTNTEGNITFLNVDLLFKRDLKYYLIHTFLPSTVLVMVSWASFWMDRRAVVARIMLVLSTLFAMSSLTTDIEASVPHVPYIKAMDLWAGMCFTFLLAALVEFAMVNATSRPDKCTNVDMKPLVQKSIDPSQYQDKTSTQSVPESIYQGLMSRFPKDPRNIDSIARILFPSLFLVLSVVYFTAQCFFE